MDLSYRRLLTLAWPLILANAAVPLLGLVDTAVIGRTGEVADLGAIALGSLIFNFVYLSFGFLRMGTTGFVAQAFGAGDEAEIRAASARSFLLGLLIGVGLVALQWPILEMAIGVLGGDEVLGEATRAYFGARIWGAPAAMVSYGVMGVLIGLGENRSLLMLQVVINGLNLVLDVIFAAVLGWGVVGIGVGTALAETTAAVMGLIIVTRLLRKRHTDVGAFWDWKRVADASRIRRTLSANADIMIRTVLMMGAFAWFARQGTQLGEATLAANHVLLQFIAFAAFFLDGFAYVTESLVGTALGQRRRDLFSESIRRTNVLAGITAVLLALGFALAGGPLIHLLTNLAPVRELATAYLGFALLYMVVAVWAFQLDGVFIGTTRTRDMRNASAASVAIFLVAERVLTTAYGNTGLWLAFVIYAGARALALLVLYPRLARSVEAA